MSGDEDGMEMEIVESTMDDVILLSDMSCTSLIP